MNKKLTTQIDLSLLKLIMNNKHSEEAVKELIPELTSQQYDRYFLDLKEIFIYPLDTDSIEEAERFIFDTLRLISCLDKKNGVIITGPISVADDTKGYTLQFININDDDPTVEYVKYLTVVAEIEGNRESYDIAGEMKQKI